MNKKEKARDAVGAAKREKGSAAGNALSPKKNYITDKKENQVFPVANLLKHGAENAIPARRLQALSGIASRRELGREIERERIEGALILSLSSEGGGYFLPSVDDKGVINEKGLLEMRRFYNSNRARAVNTFRSIKAIRKALKGYDSEGRTS